MLKVLTFMKQVANGLQVEGNFGTAHVYRSSLNAIIAYSGKVDFTFDEVSPEWLKGFEVYLRSRGCSWNTVSTYLRTFRAVYNRAVDLRKASYVYVKAVGAISSRGTYLFCIFPRNDFMDGTAVNCFIALLNGKIREKIKEETNVVYLDVFDKLLLNDKLNPDLTIDDLHLNGAGYRILVYTLRDLFLTDR